MEQNQKPDFERTLQELEALVERMEQGDITLDESLAHFERGVKLVRASQKALEEAEQKVRILVEKDGQATLEPFGPEA